MPFDTACPECSARLRLDAPPKPGTDVECPKCGALFVPPKPKKKPADVPAPKPAAAPPPAGVKKRKVKKKKTNPFVLVGSILAGFGALIGLGFAMLYVLNKAGKAEEMLTYVPGECNWARGVNCSQLQKYPGYAPEVNKHVTSEVVSAAATMAAAVGGDPDRFLDYFVCAKSLPERGKESTMYVLYTQKKFNPALLTAAVGGGPSGGKSTSAAGVLAGATIYLPPASPRVIVIVPRDSGSLNAGVLAGRENSFAAPTKGLDACGKLCARGSIWLVGKTTGKLKHYTANGTGVLDKDLPNLAAAGKAAPTFGVWTTPGGGGVRVGLAMQCADAKTASELVSGMKSGPLGKGDESEPTNQLKQAFSEASDKRFFSEIMQMMSYRSKAECAYLVTSATDERAKRLLDRYNAPSLGTEGGPPPAGSGGAAPGGGNGPARGLPGGIVTPGMGPGG